jgi:lipopolysaccharide export LptBFGC system permease protein LptF
VSTHPLDTRDGGAVGRTVRFAGIATSIIMLLAMWPPISHTWQPVGLLAILTLVPQALIVAIPMGMVVGILVGLRGRVATPRVKRSLATLGLACCVVTFVLAAWLMPAANQAFRELMAGRVILRGMNELTLGELASPQAVALVAWAGPGADRSFAFEFHFRVALAFAPLALGLFSLGVATARRGAHGGFTIAAIASATCFGYWVLLLYAARVLGRADGLPAAMAAWAPNLTFVAMTLLLHLRTRGRSAAGPSRLDDGRQSADRSADLPT